MQLNGQAANAGDPQANDLAFLVQVAAGLAHQLETQITRLEGLIATPTTDSSFVPTTPPDPSEDCRHLSIQRAEQLLERLVTRLESAVAGDKVPPTGSIPAPLGDDRQWFSTKEAASLLGLSTYTTRFYCSQGRIKAIRALSGRGLYAPWRISRDEIVRVKDHGLLPSPYKRPRRNRPRRSA